MVLAKLLSAAGRRRLTPGQVVAIPDLDRWLDVPTDRFQSAVAKLGAEFAKARATLDLTAYRAGRRAPANLAGGHDFPDVRDTFYQSDLRRIVRLHVSLTHKDDGVLAAADTLVRLLVRLAGEDDSHGEPRGPADAVDDLRAALLDEASDWISAAKVRKWERACAAAGGSCPDRAVIGGMLSPACYIPDAFPAALFLAWRYAGDVTAGGVVNALCGGDNCHRGAIVGALLAAVSPIPGRLLEGLRIGDKLATGPIGRATRQTTP